MSFGMSEGDALAWQTLASKLADYQLNIDKDDDDNMKVANLVVVGLQSAGKSRLLSALAGRMIAGAMQRNAGTRCPVVYIFETKPEKKIEVKCKTDLAAQEKSAKEASEWITAHMKKLGEDGGTGFSEEEIIVKISGPSSSIVTLVDLPGLVPEADKPENVHITKMISNYCDRSHVIPLVVTAFDNREDMGYNRSEMKRLLQTMGSKQAQKKALVIVNRLDKVRQSAKPETLQEMVSLLQGLGFDPSRVCFLSLKPQLMDGRKRDDEKDTDEGDVFDEQDKYFEKIADLDKEMMKEHAKDWTDAGFLVGLEKVRELLGETQVGNLQERISAVHHQLEKRGKVFRQQLKRIADTDKDQVKKAMTEYVEFIGAMTTAVIKGKNEMGAWDKAIEDHPHGVSSEHRDEVVELCNKTFQDEYDQFKHFLEGADRMLPLLQNRIKYSKPHSNTFIQTRINDPISGDAAMKRVAQLWTCLVMTQDIDQVSKKDMLNSCGFNDGSGSRGMSINLIVQNAVEKHCRNIVKASIEPLCNWIAHLYLNQASQTCLLVKRIVEEAGEDGKAPRSILRELDSHDEIRKQLARRIQINVKKEFEDLAATTAKEINDLLKLRLESLHLDDAFSLIRLLCCAGLSPSMLQSPPMQSQAQPHLQPPVAAQKTEHEFFSQFVQLVKTGHSPDAVDFAEGGGMQFRQILNERDLEESVDDINELIRWFARLNIGLFTRDVLNSIGLKMSANKLNLAKLITEPIQKWVDTLQAEDEKEFNRLLHEDERYLKDKHTKLLRDFGAYLEVVTAMNKCAEDCKSSKQITHIDTVEKDKQTLGRLQKVVEALEAPQPFPAGMEAEEDDSLEDFLKSQNISFDAAWKNLRNVVVVNNNTQNLINVPSPQAVQKIKSNPQLQPPRPPLAITSHAPSGEGNSPTVPESVQGGTVRDFQAPPPQDQVDDHAGYLNAMMQSAS